MAANDGDQVYSSTYTTVQASSSVANDAMSGASVTSIATAIPTTSKHFLLDFKVIVSATAPSAGSTIDIYKRNSDQAIPSITNLNTFVGSAKLDAATGNYYRRGVPNDDDLDTYYMHNKSGQTCTLELLARTRTFSVEG